MFHPWLSFSCDSCTVLPAHAVQKKKALTYASRAKLDNTAPVCAIRDLLGEKKMQKKLRAQKTCQQVMPQVSALPYDDVL